MPGLAPFGRKERALGPVYEAMQGILIVGFGATYLLMIIRIYLMESDLCRHVGLMRRALLCASVIILGGLVIMDVRAPVLPDSDAVAGTVTMDWARSAIDAWAGHLATALGLLAVIVVGLLLQGWMLLGRMRSFFAKEVQDRETRDLIELHATE